MKRDFGFIQIGSRVEIARVAFLGRARQVTARKGSAAWLGHCPQAFAALAWVVIAGNPAFAGWTEVNAGLKTAPAGIVEVTIDPSTPSTLYARTFGGMIFKSMNSAASWIPLSGASDVTSVRVDPQNSSILYAGTLRWIVKSTDAGVSWRGANTGLPGMPILHLAIHPLATTTLYAVTPGSRVFKSEDGGETWNPANGSLPSEAYVSHLTLDPLTPSTVYAVGIRGSIFKSMDGGERWSMIQSGHPSTSFAQNALSLAIDPYAPTTVYAGSFAVYSGSHRGIAKSTDGGLSWTPNKSGILEQAFICSLAVDPANPSTIYARNTDGSILKSTDAGESWFLIGPPRTPSALGDFAVDPAAPAILYAGYSDSEGNGALMKSTDGGMNWIQSSDGLSSFDIRVVAANRDTSAIYAVGNGSLFKSVDGGNGWISLDSLTMKIRNLVTDTVDANLIYAEIGRPGCSSGEPRLFKSTDGGGSWGNISPPFSGCILGGTDLSGPPPAMLVDSRGDLYIAENDIFDSNRVEKSSDRGTTWRAFTWSPAFIRSLAIEHDNPSVAFTGLSYWNPGLSTLHKSTDGGSSWTGINLGGGSVSIIAIDPKDPRVVYAGVDGDSGEPGNYQGLFKSRDSGETWFSVNNGLDSLLDLRGRMTAFMIDPSNSNVLYIGTAGLGVFQSVDGGLHWVPNNDGLGNFHVYALAIVPGEPGTLYAGTAGGIFKISCCQGSFISASPNPCVLSDNVCTPYLTWSTTGISDAQVWVKIDEGRESLYASQPFCSGTECSAPWIQGGGGVYTFTLYDCDSVSCTVNGHEGARAIGSVNVTATTERDDVTH